MSATNSPFGFRAVSMKGGQPMTGAQRAYRAGIDTAALAKGSLVSLSTRASGAHIVACTAAGVAATRSVNTVLGVVNGVSYTDQNGKQVFSQSLPANAVTAGYTNILVYVIDDPDVVFEVQASGSLTAADVGNNVETNAFTVSSGTPLTKQSTGTVASPAVITTATWRIVDIVEDSSNTAGDAFTRVRVVINPTYHMYGIVAGL